MNSAGPGRCITQTDFAGELGVGGRHEGGHFLMPHLDIFHRVLGTLQRKVEAADTIARIAVNSLEAPLMQTMPYELGDGDCHYCLQTG